MKKVVGISVKMVPVRKIAGKRLTEKNIISEKTVISYMAGWNMKETGIILEKPMMVL